MIRPARNVRGTIRLPGDKSISHRYAMLGALAEGDTRLENFSSGADCASTLACLRGLGIPIERNGGSVVIHGGKLNPPASPLDCGNSGSTMRMLGGILAGHAFPSELTGDESLSRRPMARVITPLSQMGAKITSSDGDRPPLRIQGGHLRGIEYKMPVASAQVKSAILFAGLFAAGETTVIEPLRTRDHTELALQAFGGRIDKNGNEVRISGGQNLRAIEATVPGDISSAAFFLCAVGLFPGSQLIVTDLLLNPSRARLLDVMAVAGLGITIAKIEQHHGEVVGTIQVQGRRLKGMSLAGADAAALIDEVPVLAAIAPYMEQGIEVRDARELRVKESDRIAALVSNLRKMGAEVEERDDGLKIPGGQTLRGAEIDSMGDHRIAMAFAIAALRAEEDTRIKGADAAVISYPEFFEALESIVER